MSKKQQLKKAKREGGIPGEIALSTSQIKQDPLNFKKVRLVMAITLAAFAFVLYAQTIGFDYTLDDRASISENRIVKQGVQGIPTLFTTDYWYGYSEKLRGTQYRPVSLVMFAIEWQIFPQNAGVSHFINVLLYALTGLFLFFLLSKLFSAQNLLLPFLCTILFIGHPIHTEVVSNIKSRDEIMCLLFSIAAMLSSLKYYAGKNLIWLILTGVFFFLSILSKETGIAFLLVIPLIVFVVRPTDIKKLFLLFITLAAFSGLYFLIRSLVIQGVPPINLQVIDNSLTDTQSTVGRLATTFYILFKYLGLLFFPQSLSYDYSFSQIPLQDMASPLALLGILVYLTLGIYAFLNIRKKGQMAFAILFYLLTLAPVSNVFLLIGSTMAERFLYIPSLGFCLAVCMLIMKITSADQVILKKESFGGLLTSYKKVCSIVFILAVVYALKTFSRSGDWKNNVSLFRHDVEVAPNSARTHYNWGVSLIQDLYNKEESKTGRQEYLEESRVQLEKAIEIYPSFFDAHKTLGYVYLKQGNYSKAITHLETYLTTNPKEEAAYNNKAAALMGMQNYTDAIPVLQKALEINDMDTTANKNLGRCYAYSQQYENAIKYFLKCVELAPGIKENYSFVAIAYQLSGDSVKAKSYLLKAAGMVP